MLHTLENAFWQVGILPDTGASLAFGRINHGDKWLDFMRPTPESSSQNASDCASFVLIPWSNRLRDGQFRFRGNAYQLRVNTGDGTAIHGAAREFPWAVESADSSQMVVSFDSANYPGVNFPWRFFARLQLRLEAERFSLTVWLKNEDKTAIPAGFGHHPYFMRTLSGPSDAAKVEVPCAQYFELEKCLPSAAPVPVVPRVNFQTLHPLGEVFIDDCLTGRAPGRPIRFVYDKSGVAVAMHCDEVFQNIVFYLPQGKPFFAVEPVTNANDGFNLYDKSIPGSGVFVLEPGQEKQGTVTLQLER